MNITNVNCVFKTVNISKNDIVYLSHKKYPNLKVIDAVKMTTCIPIIFKPIIYNGIIMLMVDYVVIIQ